MKYLRTAALVLMTLSPAVGMARPGPGGPLARMSEELSLTDAQKTEIQKIQKNGKAGMQSQRAAFKDARDALNQVMSSSTSTKDQLLAAHEKFAQAKLEMMRLQFAQIVEMRTVLTPEQLQKLPEVAPMDRGPRGEFRRGEDGESNNAVNK